MSVDRSYLASLRRELADTKDQSKRDQIQEEIRRVGSGDNPSQPSEVDRPAAQKSAPAPKPVTKTK